MGYVYFIRKGSEDIFKIGIAVDPHSRLIGMMTGNDAKLYLCATIETDNARDLETHLHRLFKPRRINLEWFRLQWADIDRLLGDYEMIGDVTVYHDAIFASEEHPKLGIASPDAAQDFRNHIEALQKTIRKMEREVAEMRLSQLKTHAEKVACICALMDSDVPIPAEVEPVSHVELALIKGFLGKGYTAAQIAYETRVILNNAAADFQAAAENDVAQPIA